MGAKETGRMLGRDKARPARKARPPTGLSPGHQALKLINEWSNRRVGCNNNTGSPAKDVFAGSYCLDRLIARFGADAALPNVLVELATRERRADFSRPCGARFADLTARRRGGSP